MLDRRGLAGAAGGGGTSLGYLHFPELRGSESDLSLGQPSCLAWEG